MHSPSDRQETLHTTTGDFPLHEYRLGLAGREWSILHTGAMLTLADEARFFREARFLLPYGVALWPASIALAHDVASRADTFRDTQVLELGAGTGLPGIVAASFGGRVVQTDRQEVAMSICKRNAQRNGVESIEHRLVDWTEWDDTKRYDWIIGSDILYTEDMHPHLRRIFETNLAPEGRVLISDPFRDVSFHLLEALEGEGWRVGLSKWSVGEEDEPRAIGLFELARPK